ncbi:DUF3231 family protein [Bacillus suaedaesalsae]|uniref:DUF3231 family protein n=1 Tax=Bacillus suaedaesalsae TaxID=2810349 RepID=A0ABS2DM99_9BACI|nr:DUF3231 family protein [Bacillus suaedaesalsae]MBM6619630.1 DUF3231 family protein [Bacillus suaedaesalsae]
MEHKPVKLTANEKAYLWTNYMVDSMAVCCLSYYIEKCEDSEIHDILSFALDLSKKHTQFVKETFTKEKYPVPIGFTEADVNLQAPKLFSDEFVLLYLHNLANEGLMYYSKALSMTAREDVHDFYVKCISSSTELNTRTKMLLLSKGLYIRPPYIPDSNHPEMIEELGFMKGFLGKQRPLISMEIANLYFNLITLEVVKTLMIGFAQVASNKDVKDFITRGKDLCNKTIEQFSSILQKEELPASKPWYTHVTDSTESPFSDKLLMFHGSVLNAGGVEQYGFSLASSIKRDIGARYAQLITEMLTYSDDGMNLMIKHQWLEQPPMNVDRGELK